MPMPCLQYDFTICLNEAANPVQLVGREAVVLGQLQRCKPELAAQLLAGDVNMLRFVAIETVEVETVWPRGKSPPATKIAGATTLC